MGHELEEQTMRTQTWILISLATSLALLGASCGDGVIGGGGGSGAYGAVGDAPSEHTKLLSGFWHRPGNEDPLANCTACHGEELEGGAGPSCYTCHDASGHNTKREGVYHRSGSSTSCNICHGPDNKGGLGPACSTCHGGGGGGDTATGHTKLLSGIAHRPGNEDPLANCTDCHGGKLQGGTGPSCYSCHDDSGHNSKREGVYHKSGTSASCNICHGPGNKGGLGPACTKCHGAGEDDD